MYDTPRILVFGQPFDDFSGGGITLSNLFKGWPIDKIASLWAPWDDSYYTNDVCKIHYKIGREERKWRFPFYLYKRPFPPSGSEGMPDKQNYSLTKHSDGIKNKITGGIINPTLSWLGMYYNSSTISFSPNLKRWLNDFRPELLYFQVSTYEGIRFAHQLIEYLKIPSVIHMMDDWPSTISNHGLLKNYWQNRIDRKFRILLNRVNLALSISDSMSEEYNRRYHKEFIPFHNPVDLSLFKSKQAKKVLNNEVIKVLYIGRIGTANANSIIQIANIVSRKNETTKHLEFYIYSKDFGLPQIKRLGSFEGVYIYPPVPHEKVPDLYPMFDILLLPLDFTAAGLKFAKLSIPTKATEYMLTGIPILVFAPEVTAVSRFFRQNNCGHCLTKNSPEAILDSLERLTTDIEYRDQLGQNAVKIALQNFDAEKVRLRFRETLSKTAFQNESS